MNKIISSKEFNLRLSMETAQELEELSQQAWSVLHEKAAEFDVDEIEGLFPAYICTTSKNPSVVVMFPTYMIDVHGVDDDDKNHLNRVEIIRGFLEESNGVKDRVEYSVTVKPMFDLFTSKTWDEPVVQIKCSDFGLEKNTVLKESIITILRDKGYSIDVSIDINYFPSSIEMLDDKKFRIKEQSS